LHKTESAGKTAWRPYAPTGAMRNDDGDDDDDDDDDDDTTLDRPH